LPKQEKNKTIEKILVALDLSEMDDIIIDYAKFISDFWEIKQIGFIHNIKKSDLYGLWNGFLEEEKIPLEKMINKEISEKIDNVFDATVSYTVEVTADDYTESVIKRKVKENQIDLLLLGKKHDLKGTGSLAHKLMNLLDCDVLFVPEQVNHQLKDVLLPTDFTQNSAKAFKKALYFDSKQNWNMEALHVYSIPSVYFPYIDREKAIDKTQETVLAKFKNFENRFKLGDFSFHQIYRENLSVVESILEEATQKKADMIMLSAKGGNKITTLFVGSTTSDLLLNESDLPVYVVK